MIDAVSDSYPIVKSLITEPSTVVMELIELQEDLGLKLIHKSQSANMFWKHIPKIKYSELKKIRARLISISSTTCCQESLYSVMKFVKSKLRENLTNPSPNRVDSYNLDNMSAIFQLLTAKIEIHKASAGITNNLARYALLCVCCHKNIIIRLTLHVGPDLNISNFIGSLFYICSTMF